MTYELNHPELRAAVAQLCKRFPGRYWQECDRNQAYPKAFVTALTEAGYLAALIPEAHGGLSLPLSAGAAILEEIHRAGCNAAACHAQMYTMGTLLRHGSDAQKSKYLPQIAQGNLRLQAFGVTEPTSGTETSALRCTARKEGQAYIVNGQKNLDQPRRTFRFIIALGAYHAARSGEKTHRGLISFSGGYARSKPKRAEHSPHSHDDEPRHNRIVF
jgi:acyl-CoA dehydrogenase